MKELIPFKSLTGSVGKEPSSRLESSSIHIAEVLKCLKWNSVGLDTDPHGMPLVRHHLPLVQPCWLSQITSLSSTSCICHIWGWCVTEWATGAKFIPCGQPFVLQKSHHDEILTQKSRTKWHAVWTAFSITKLEKFKTTIYEYYYSKTLIIKFVQGFLTQKYMQK